MTAPWVLDALSNDFIAGGQILMIQRQWEQYIFWIALDIDKLLMFSCVAPDFVFDFNIVCMHSFFILVGLCSLWSWYRRPVNDNEEIEGNGANPDSPTGNDS